MYGPSSPFSPSSPYAGNSIYIQRNTPAVRTGAAASPTAKRAAEFVRSALGRSVIPSVAGELSPHQTPPSPLRAGLHASVTRGQSQKEMERSERESTKQFEDIMYRIATNQPLQGIIPPGIVSPARKGQATVADFDAMNKSIVHMKRIQALRTSIKTDQSKIMGELEKLKKSGEIPATHSIPDWNAWRDLAKGKGLFNADRRLKDAIKKKNPRINALNTILKENLEELWKLEAELKGIDEHGVKDPTGNWKAFMGHLGKERESLDDAFVNPGAGTQMAKGEFWKKKLDLIKVIMRAKIYDQFFEMRKNFNKPSESTPDLSLDLRKQITIDEEGERQNIFIKLLTQNPGIHETFTKMKKEFISSLPGRTEEFFKNKEAQTRKIQEYLKNIGDVMIDVNNLTDLPASTLKELIIARKKEALGEIEKELLRLPVSSSAKDIKAYIGTLKKMVDERR
jgi:hypothetical protein